jgi:pyruvate carboxylase
VSFPHGAARSLPHGNPRKAHIALAREKGEAGVSQRNFQRILVANRGEIAVRVFQACTELGKQTIAIYSEADALAPHRYKADEAYLVGAGQTPVGAYLDGEGIVALAVAQEIDAIHPGYGFLAENAAFARRYREAGIAFIGPDPAHLDLFGDKTRARALADACR